MTICSGVGPVLDQPVHSRSEFPPGQAGEAFGLGGKRDRHPGFAVVEILESTGFEPGADFEMGLGQLETGGDVRIVGGVLRRRGGGGSLLYRNRASACGNEGKMNRFDGGAGGRFIKVRGQGTPASPETKHQGAAVGAGGLEPIPVLL